MTNTSILDAVRGAGADLSITSDYTPGPETLIVDIARPMVTSDIYALAGGGYVVVYQQLDDFFDTPVWGGSHIQVYDSAGEKVGTGTHYEFAGRDEKTFDGVIALNDGGFILTWNDWLASRSVQRYDAAGHEVGSEIPVTQKIVGTFGDGYIGVGVDSQGDASAGLYYQLYDQDFQPTGPTVQIDGDGVFTRHLEDFVKLDGGGFVFVFYNASPDSGSVGLYAQQFDSTGQTAGEKFRVDPTHPAAGQYSADIAALANGGYVITWLNYGGNPLKEDILVQCFDSAGNRVGEEMQIPSGGRNNAYGSKIVGLDDGSYVVVWRGDGTTTDHIFAQRFDETGAKSGALTAVSVSPQHYASYNVVALTDGSYVLEWMETDYVNMQSKMYREVFTPVAEPTSPFDIVGDDHDNTLDGSTGIGMQMHGLAGNDTYRVDDAADRVFEAADSGNDTVMSSIRFTLGDHVENLILTGAATRGYGNDAGNVLTGNDLGNVLRGLGGDDSLMGGLGKDTLFGGAGDDSYWVNSGDQLRESADQGTDTVYASSSFRLATGQSIEKLTLTGTGDTGAIGNDLDNRLTGNTGNNRLNGGLGADTMTGGDGDDTYYVDNASDSVSDSGDGVDRVVSVVSFTLSDDVEHLILSGTADIDGTGNGLANILIGNSGNNRLDGGLGADTLAGGEGDDSYYIDNAGDRVGELAGAGWDAVYASVSFSLRDGVESLFLTGLANINAAGNGLGNSLTGNAGDNRIIGGAGDDMLAGGHGADTFIFGAGSGADVISDFSAAEGDLIHVRGYSNKVPYGGGITVTQVGLDTVIDLSGGNVVTIQQAAIAEVTSHIVW